VVAANFHECSNAAMKTMVTHDNTIWALGDSGAHCGLLCDASLPTYMLQRWSAPNGGPLPIERVIKGLTSEAAASVGLDLDDRGILAPGYRADINVIRYWPSRGRSQILTWGGGLNDAGC
jgi:N-acyl-D-amino-acid deacylase